MSRKLLRSATPTPGESLRGLVLDACADNRLPHSFLLLRHFGMAHRNRVIVSESSSLNSAGLAAALRIDEDQIKLRQYASVGGANRSFFGLIVSKTQIESRVRRFSPTAINNGITYHPATHELRDLPFSTVGWDILQTRCRCTVEGVIQRWIKANGTSRCDACGASLGKVPAITIPEEWRKPLSLIAGLVDPDPHAQQRAIRQLPYSLHDADRTLLFNMIKNIARVNSKRKYANDPLVWTRAIADACQNLLTWNGLLDQAVRSPDCPEHLWWWVRRFYPILDTCRTLSGPFKENCGAGVPQYSPIGTVGKVRFDRLSLNATAKLVSIDVCALKKAWDNGQLTQHEMVFAGKRVRAFDPDEVVKITHTLRTTTARTETGHHLGLPVYGIEQLIATGLIRPAAPNAEINQSAAHAIATRHFVQRLTKRKRSKIDGPISLFDAVRHVSGRKKPWGAVLYALIDGSIPFTMKESNLSHNVLRNVEVPLTSVPTICSLSADITEANFQFSDQLKQIDALEVLNAYRGDPGPLEGLSYAGQNPKLYRVQDVLLRAMEGVTTSDLSRRTGISIRRVGDILGRASVPKIAPGLWDRGVAEATLSMASRSNYLQVSYVHQDASSSHILRIAETYERKL